MPACRAINRKTAYVVDTRPNPADPTSQPIFPEFQGQAVGTPFIDELRTAKATANVTSAQFLQLRYGYQKNSDIYGASARLVPSALGTTTNLYKSVLAGHTWQLGSSSLNEFVYQWTTFKNGISPNSNDPLLVFPSGVRSGQNVNTPQSTNQEKSQFKDDFSFSTTLGGRRHDLKGGLNYIS